MSGKQYCADAEQSRHLERGTASLVAETLNIAIKHYQAGRLDEAEIFFRKAIALQPDHPGAHNKLGIVLTQQGHLDQAVECYRKAIALQPDHPNARNNLGIVLEEQGHLDQAVECYRKAIALQPDHLNAHNNLANILAQQGHLDQAVECCRKAIAIKPDYPHTHYNLGNVLRRQGHLDQAVGCYRKAIALQPDYPDAYRNLGSALEEQGYPEAHNKLGIALMEQGHLDQAVECFHKAIALQPDVPEAHNSLGIALMEQGHLDQAVECFHKAIAIKPDYPDAHSNLGIVLGEQGHLDHAVECYRKAIAIKPDHPNAHNNLGIALMEQGHLDQAVECYRKAIAIKPDYPDAHHHLAMALLAQGEMTEGWKEYEWRKRLKQPVAARSYPKPLWLGQDHIAGKILFLYPEQALGDTVQFCRYAREAEARGATVVMEVQAPLRRLMRQLSPAIRLATHEEAPGDFEYHCPLQSLPLAFGTDLTSIPAAVPYLSAEPDLVERWRARIGGHGFRVGIAWQGNPSGRVDLGRSIPLAMFAPLARIPGVRLISLQKETGVEQLSRLPLGLEVETLGEDFDAGADAFIDTAAVMENLNLVVTSDTSVAHVAGALARPVWVALKRYADWRWLLKREDSPWYPTMRLFRQTAQGDWASVFSRMADELRLLAARRAEAPPTGATPAVPVSWGELLDKISILEIKEQRLTSAAALDNVRRELAALRAAAAGLPTASAELAALRAELRVVNEALWKVEDMIRAKEAAGAFDEGFIELARSVYHENDRRGRVKRQINQMLGSQLVEEKQYAAYTTLPRNTKAAPYDERAALLIRPSLS
jgi:tetratricopeptide (TPR) repeat protein